MDVLTSASISAQTADPCSNDTIMGPPQLPQQQALPNSTQASTCSSPTETTGNQPPPPAATTGAAAATGGPPPITRTVSEKNAGSSGRTSYSCAECKRLKLKCSRQWPCTSCVRRGVEQICPNGAMTGGKGRRLILAETKELHERIADLEKALAISHAKSATDPHILLTNTYLYSPRDPASGAGKGNVGKKGKLPSRLAGSSKVGRRGRGDDEEQDEDGMTDEEVGEISLGTLTIGANGEAQFVGASAGSSLLHAEGPSPSGASTDYTSRNGPPTILHHPRLSRSSTQYITRPSALGISSPAEENLLDDFPFVGVNGNNLSLLEIWGLLPAWEAESSLANSGRVADEGNRMVQAYWENVGWMYDCIPRLIFDNDYLPSVYSATLPPNPHKLAVVYLVMALGVMFDLERREPFDPLAAELFRLGSACLTVNGALARPSVATVQALNLIGNFMLNQRETDGANAYWPILGVGGYTVTALGLHRDGTAFSGLSPYETEERRKVFWEMMTLDRLQAMCFARPCALSNRSVDTKFPGEDALIGEEGLPDQDHFHDAKYRLVYIMDKVIDEQTKTSRTTYKDILAIDGEIQKFAMELPQEMQPGVKASSLELGPDVNPHTILHRFSIRLLIQETIIYLHRAYFVKALQENPTDPSKSDGRFSRSFLSVFEACVELISIVRQSVIYHPALIGRWWFYWFHAFSAAVCLGAICIEAPSSAFAAPAYMSLVTACDLAQAATEGSKAKGGLPVLQRLRQRASNAMLSIARRPSASAAKTVERIRQEHEQDDLLHLANRTQLRRVTITSPAISTPTLATGTSASLTPPGPPSVFTVDAGGNGFMWNHAGDGGDGLHRGDGAGNGSPGPNVNAAYNDSGNASSSPVDLLNPGPSRQADLRGPRGQQQQARSFRTLPRSRPARPPQQSDTMTAASAGSSTQHRTSLTAKEFQTVSPHSQGVFIPAPSLGYPAHHSMNGHSQASEARTGGRTSLRVLPFEHMNAFGMPIGMDPNDQNTTFRPTSQAYNHRSYNAERPADQSGRTTSLNDLHPMQGREFAYPANHEQQPSQIMPMGPRQPDLTAQSASSAHTNAPHESQRNDQTSSRGFREMMAHSAAFPGNSDFGGSALEIDMDMRTWRTMGDMNSLNGMTSLDTIDMDIGMPLLPPGGSLHDVEQFIAGWHEQ
ncbi:hypothetical protein QFC21_002763 [Naganishia friedmannii]|uniref:Uncharacterized protein n=1 Tax=Naganishia friedmannii TaxID=89922 RepID=A0ACC2VTB9_9TREE|nr:hypothetical protein QFC21_002763 [Naganishia friedmannii]